MTITELPTLTYHFFKNNEIIITDASFSLIYKYTDTNDYGEGFTLDAQSFDMFKLIGNATLSGANIIMKNDKLKYKCNLLDIKLPELNLDEIIFTNNYSLNKLINATKFVSADREALNGVLITDTGSIFSTNAYTFYYNLAENIAYNRIISVPVEFIALIPKNTTQAKITATKSKIMYSCDNLTIIGTQLAGLIPNLSQLITKFKSHYSYKFTATKLNLLRTDTVEITDKYIDFRDNEKQLTYTDLIKTDAEFQVKYSSTQFDKIISLYQDTTITADVSDNITRFNNEILLCHTR